MNTTYIDHMGTDLTVVNAARVSFKKTSSALKDSDSRLINFLARGCTTGDWYSLLDELFNDDLGLDEKKEVIREIKNMPTHWTPFGHCQATLHMKIPIFVARQLAKHQVGFVINEVSRRYVSDDPEFYHPDVWRLKADNVKQGSSEDTIMAPMGPEHQGIDWAAEHFTKSLEVYQSFLNAGICPEQARMVLPQSMYTEWYMTGSLYGWANMYIQRSNSHAQLETQQVAAQVDAIMKPLFPVSWDALTKN